MKFLVCVRRSDIGVVILQPGGTRHFLFETGGEGGIRTPGTGFSQHNGLANRRLKPLGHLSAACFKSLA